MHDYSCIHLKHISRLLQVKLKDNDIGQLYVFIQTDYYRRTSDIDSSNNVLKANDLIDAKLTPPPDLRVDSVAVPSSSYSGKYHREIFFEFTCMA